VPLACAALVLALAGGGAASAGAAVAPNDRLVLQAADVPGLRPGPAGLRAARAGLAQALGEVESSPGTPTRIEAAGFRGAGKRAPQLTIRAFALRTPAAARAALARLRRSTRLAGHKPRSVGVGSGGYTVARRTAGRSDLSAVFRVGSVVASLRYRSTVSPKIARGIALDYAQLQASRLVRVDARTVGDRVGDGIRAGGTIPTRTVLQMAALLYGPIDGVTLPAGRRGDPPLDGTSVIQALIEAAPKLTPAQRRAVERAVAVRGSGARTTTRSASAVRSSKAGDCQFEMDGNRLNATASARFDAIRDAMAARIGGLGFAPAWQTCVYDWRAPDGAAGADTTQWVTSATSSPYDAGILDAISAIRPDMCFIRKFPLLDELSAANQGMALAHEVFHCLQREWLRGHVDHNPPCADEALANWAGHQISPGTYLPSDRLPGAHFERWASVWQLSLLERTYPAWGFWGVVEQIAGAEALWNRIVLVWGAGGSNEAVWAVGAGANAPEVLDTWGAGLFREESFPAAWMQRLPFAVPDRRGADNNKPVVELTNERTTRLETRDYKATMYVVHASSHPLVRVSVEGNGRVTDGRTDWLRPSGLWVCFGGACACPAGQIERVSIPLHEDIGASLYAGIAAAAEPSTLVLEPHEMSEYCETPPPPPGGGGGGPGPGETHSEPHLWTFDGLAYDLQSAGEFILARSADGRFEVQARMEPADESQLATTNTAVAMRADGHRIAVYGYPGVTLRVDGRVRPLGRDEAIEVGNARVRRVGPIFYVQWPDGSQVRVDVHTPTALRIAVEPSDALLGRVRGVLGSNDGNPGNDLVTAGGVQLDYRVSGGGRPHIPTFPSGVDDFKWIHGPYAESWRIRQAASLFDYRPGQSTATFTNRSVPRNEITLADFTAAQRSRAQRSCAGIEETSARRACERDVALTNNPVFAQTARRAERGRAGWRPLDGFEARVGPLSAIVGGDGTIVFAAQNALFRVETFATSVTVPPRSAALPPALIERGLVGDPFLYRTADGTVAASLPVDDLATGIGGVRTYVLPPGGGAVRSTDATTGVYAPRGPAPGAATSAGSVVAANGPSGIELFAGSGQTARSAALPADGSDCSPVAPNLIAAADRMWLAWTGALCTDSGPRVVAIDPATGTPGVPLRAPAALPGLLLPSQQVTSLAVRPDGGAVLAYPGLGRVLLWHAGDAAPIELGRTGNSTTDAALVAAEPTSGRVWAAWRDPAKGTLVVRRSDGDGRTFGPARTVSPPLDLSDSDRRVGEWIIAAGDGRLVVAFSVRGLSSNPGSAWYTTLRS